MDYELEQMIHRYIKVALDWGIISRELLQVMVNANKFIIIGIEAFGMHTKVREKGRRHRHPT